MKPLYLATLGCLSIFAVTYCAIAGKDRYEELEASFHRVPSILFSEGGA